MISFGIYGFRKTWQESVTLTDVCVDVTVRTASLKIWALHYGL